MTTSPGDHDQPNHLLSGHVETDRRCSRCAYNLRGLATNGLCPECGALVADALDDDELLCADPRWLDAIIRGSLIMALAIILLTATCLVALFDAFTLATWLPAITGVAMLVMGVGNWLLTTPRIDTRPYETRLQTRVRFASRWVGVVLSACAAGQLITGQSPGIAPVYWVTGYYLLTLFYINVHALHLRTLSLQVGHDRVMHSTITFHAIATIIGVGFVMLQLRIAPSNIMEVQCCTLPLWLIAAMSWVPLLLRLCDEFRLARQIIREK